MSSERESFLGAHGWGGASVRALAGDASQRRFERLSLGERTAVLITSTPGSADTAAFIRIAGLLRDCGLSAPEILAADVPRGMILAEDFGDVCLGRLPAAAVDPGPFCSEGVAVLIALHRGFDPSLPAAIDLPKFTPALFREQVSLFLDTYLPAVHGVPADEATRAGFRAAWASVLPLADQVPRSLLLRDYHLGNLMRLADRSGARGCGLLDFQDAGIGPVTYDLVSLLEDARLPTDACAESLYTRYREAFPALDPAAFATSCAVLAAQRHCRILAVFARLALEQGKRDYLRHLPRVWRLLDRRLATPALAPVAGWFAANLPPATRIPAALRAGAG